MVRAIRLHTAMQRVSWMAYMVLCTLMLCFIWYCWYARCLDGPDIVATSHGKLVYDSSDRAYEYHRDMPIIFIGGIPRSGTTLMRAILDAHPDIRCGEETRVIPRLLGMRSQWMKSDKEKHRLEEAGLTDDVIKSAVAAFILEVVAKHGEPARTLCNKDPFTLRSTTFLAQVFPNAKFILMIRDGRAVVHSIISRKITISGFNLRSFRQCLEKWNSGVETMYAQCVEAGEERCLPVHYEQLVLHPRQTLVDVLQFVGVTWDDAVLHHDDYINVPGGVSLSNVERSTDQVIKPVNVEALTRWVGHVPSDVKASIHTIAPMLAELGYDPHAYPPYYGRPDSIVVSNTNFVKANTSYWQEMTNKLQESAKLTPHVDETGAFKFRLNSLRGAVNGSRHGAVNSANSDVTSRTSFS